MCETCLSVLTECVWEACAAHMQICLAKIRRVCVCCMCVFETCLALICRQPVQHVLEEACEMWLGCVILEPGSERQRFDKEIERSQSF